MREVFLSSFSLGYQEGDSVASCARMRKKNLVLRWYAVFMKFLSGNVQLHLGSYR